MPNNHKCRHRLSFFYLEAGLPEESAEFLGDLVVARLLIADGVHLIHSYHQLRNTCNKTKACVSQVSYIVICK